MADGVVKPQELVNSLFVKSVKHASGFLSRCFVVALAFIVVVVVC